MPRTASVTQLLSELQGGSQESADRPVPLVYGGMGVAYKWPNHTLQAA